MEGLITGPLAEALKGGRDRFNTRFAYARRNNPSLDADAFAEHLRSVLGPIADALGFTACRPGSNSWSSRALSAERTTAKQARNDGRRPTA
jgi:hypothetical protein